MIKLLKQDYDYQTPLYTKRFSINYDGEVYHTDASIWKDGDTYTIDFGQQSGSEVDNEWILRKMPSAPTWDWSDQSLQYMKRQCVKAVRDIEDYFNEHQSMKQELYNDKMPKRKLGGFKRIEHL